MTSRVSLSIVTLLPRFVVALSKPEAFSVILEMSEGNLVPERDFERFRIPDAIIQEHAPDAVHPHVSIELQVFSGTIKPFRRLVSHSVTRFVDVTANPESQWFRSDNKGEIVITSGQLVNRGQSVVCGVRRMGNGPGVLHAITAYAPPVHWYDRQLDRKDGFG